MKIYNIQIESFLEKEFKKQKTTGGEKNTKQLAIRALLVGLGIDLRSSDLEAAVVTKSDGKFHRLSEPEIESILAAIAELD